MQKCTRRLLNLLIEKTGVVSNRDRVRKHLQQPTLQDETGIKTIQKTAAMVSATAYNDSASTLTTEIRTLPRGHPTDLTVDAPDSVATRNAVLAFDVDGYYKVRPAFLEVIRQIPEVNKNRVIFKYKEVCRILSLIPCLLCSKFRLLWYEVLLVISFQCSFQPFFPFYMNSWKTQKHVKSGSNENYFSFLLLASHASVFLWWRFHLCM